MLIFPKTYFQYICHRKELQADHVITIAPPISVSKLDASNYTRSGGIFVSDVYSWHNKPLFGKCVFS